jgi:hypothetical protein
MKAHRYGFLSAVLLLSGFQGRGSRSLRAGLSSIEEVPVILTTANGEFQARINQAGTAIEYELSYRGVQGGNAGSCVVAVASPRVRRSKEQSSRP